jgi:uncharacterized membrane protein
MTISTNVEASRDQRNSSDQYPSRIARAASVLSGTALAALGLTRRGWTRTTLAASGGYLVYRGITGKAAPYKGAVRVAFTIDRPTEEVYSFVRDPQNWPRFLQGIEMEPGQEGSLKLSLGKPAGLDICSEAIVTDERDHEHIAWSSLPGALQHRGVIRFRRAPAHRGPESSVACE